MCGVLPMVARTLEAFMACSLWMVVARPAGAAAARCPLGPSPRLDCANYRRSRPAAAARGTARNPDMDDPWFKFFFGDQGGPSEPQVGLGSGVIVSPNGYILTNNHVVDGADDIEVILNDTRKAKAKIIGTDPETDLAILKIEL